MLELWNGSLRLIDESTNTNAISGFCTGNSVVARYEDTGIQFARKELCEGGNCGETDKQI